MKIRKLLILLGALALASLTLGHVSAKEYEWDVTMGDKGLPVEIFYADEHMWISIKPQEFLARSGGGWKVDFITIEAIVDENFHSDTATPMGSATHVVGTSVLGDTFSQPPAMHKGDSVELKLANPNHLVIKDAPVNCGSLTLRQTLKPLGSYGRGEVFLTKEALVDDMDVLKVIDMWREAPPRLAKKRSHIANLIKQDNYDGQYEAVSPDEAGKPPWGKVWYRDKTSCAEKLGKQRKERAETLKREMEHLANIELLKETTAQDEVILLVTNQKLLKCAFDPACEKKVYAGADLCKEKYKRTYVESCIRAIDVSP